MPDPKLLYRSDSTLLSKLANTRSLLVPFGFILLLSIIIVPMPTPIIDMLIAVNLSLAAIILLTTVYMERPLEFSAFPSLLLATTLFRLALNIATTRLILTADASTPAQAEGVAGQVIKAFGEFVAGNNPIVGAVIFLILVIVQFVVITKGSSRISEVAARFTLDAMPGKQMAIDADLTAGLIDEDEARERRETITREADFYGAMDGASKFVRGDAIAGIIITLVNILGGFAVGAMYKHWGITESLAIFTKLTIGDGLVSQMPSFIIATAAGLIVARSGAKDDLSTELTGQLTREPRALLFTVLFLIIMSVTGMPFIPMILCAAILATMAFLVNKGVRNAELVKRQAAQKEVTDAELSAKLPQIDDLLKIDLLELEVGYGLVQIVNKSDGGDLLDRIAMIRRQLALENGFVLPPVRIRDNAQLDQHLYRLKIRGAVIAESIIYPNMWLAMDSGLVTNTIDGIATKEPAFGLDACWIEEHLRERAETFGYTVVDATSVLITHFTEVIRNHADELLTREEVNNLIEGVKERAPKLVEEVIPDKVKPAELQKVLQALLRERVPIRDLESILETLSDWIAHTKDIDILVEYVRHALRRSIVAQYANRDEQGQMKIYCVTVDPKLEDVISSHVDRTATGTIITMPPSVANRISTRIINSLQELIKAGYPPIVLTSPQVRGPVRKIVESQLASIVVLGYNEIPTGMDVESLDLITLDKPGKVVAA